MYAEIARPMYAMLVVFKWTPECDISFEKLKNELITAPILRAPDWNKLSHVHIYASAFAIHRLHFS